VTRAIEPKINTAQRLVSDSSEGILKAKMALEECLLWRRPPVVLQTELPVGNNVEGLEF
jgi:hypothetical protein